MWQRSSCIFISQISPIFTQPQLNLNHPHLEVRQKFILPGTYVSKLTNFASATSTIHQPTQLMHSLTCYMFVRNLHPMKAQTNTNSWENNTCQMVTHPGTNTPNSCLTSTRSVTGILPLSSWDKIKFRWGSTHLSYIPMHPLSNHFTRWQGC